MKAITSFAKGVNFFAVLLKKDCTEKIYCQIRDVLLSHFLSLEWRRLEGEEGGNEIFFEFSLSKEVVTELSSIIDLSKYKVSIREEEREVIFSGVIELKQKLVCLSQEALEKLQRAQKFLIVVGLLNECPYKKDELFPEKLAKAINDYLLQLPEIPEPFQEVVASPAQC